MPEDDNKESEDFFNALNNAPYELEPEPEPEPEPPAQNNGG